MSARAAPGRGAYANAALNLVAGILPIPLAIVTVPLVIRGFGVERYGVLATAAVVLAYFALLDIGLGRAGTRFLAQALSGADQPHVAETFWTMLALAGAVGVAGGLLMLAVAGPFVEHVLRMPAALVAEGRTAGYALAAAILPAILAPTALGALEGQRRFDLVAAIQVPTAVLSLLAPLMVLPFTTHIAPVIALIAALQALAFGFALTACLVTIPAVRQVRVRGAEVRRLLGYGRWVAVSNVIGPLMVNADRVAIGGVLSVSWVTFYAAPYELVTKLSLVPSALMRAMFPLFSADQTHDVREARALAMQGARAIAVILGPAAIGLVALSPDVLRIWLGPDFERASTATLQLLAVGVTVNALAMVPFWLLQGLGRPDVSAKFHVMELVLYVPLLFFALGRWGITGAAVAWTVRVALDAALLFVSSRVLFGAWREGAEARALAWFVGALAVLLGLAHLAAARLAAGVPHLLAGAALGGGAAAAGFGLVLTAGERAAARALAGRLIPRRGDG